MDDMSGKWVRLTKNPAVWKRTFAPGVTGYVRRIYNADRLVSYVWTLYRDRKEVACEKETYLPRAKYAVEIALRNSAVAASAREVTRPPTTRGGEGI